MQIDFTWNLFATPIVVAISTAIITGFMHKREKRREEAEAKMARLLQEKEKMKEDELSAWRTRYTTTMCDLKKDLKEGLSSINHELSETVRKGDCGKEMDYAYNRINHHEHNDAGKVVIL